MTSKPHTLMLIPARGGSKRLADKCLRPVGGLTLLARAISVARRTAEQLEASARIVVSTDDTRIAEVARRCGADVPFMRPVELSGDDAPTASAIRHTLAFFAGRGESFDEIILLQPTSPLRTAADVTRTVREFRRDTSHPAVTVREGAAASPALQFSVRDRLLVARDEGGDPVALNGAVYVFHPDWVRERDVIAIAGATRAVLMPTERSIDVDTADDLARVQAVWEAASPWPRDRCYLIAEAGVNHDGNLADARRLVEAAADAGADAVKFQTFDPHRLASQSAPQAEYQARHTTQGKTQCDMLAGLALTPEDHRALQQHCRDRGIAFLSSAFGIEDVDLLDAFDLPMLKIGSGEITHAALLAHAARTLRPIILSTGAADLSEVAAAVDILRQNGCDRLALLHCVSAYPAACADLNLRAIPTLAEAFAVPVGFSDHTLSIEAACGAVALGSRIIEKHLTLDRMRSGPDHRASLEPHEFSAMIQAVRNVQAALGDGIKQPCAAENDVRFAARRSIVAARDLEAGTILTGEHIAAKRPAGGICPTMAHLLIGRRLTCTVRRDQAITWTDVAAVGDATCAR